MMVIGLRRIADKTVAVVIRNSFGSEATDSANVSLRVALLSLELSWPRVLSDLRMRVSKDGSCTQSCLAPSSGSGFRHSKLKTT